MVIFYDTDKELYFQVYVGVIDIKGEWADYEMSDRLVKEIPESYDKQRGVYLVAGDFWEDFKQELDDWLFDENSYIRTWDEERHYEIYTAKPLYKVYDKCDVWRNENWDDTLDDVQRNFLDSPQNQFDQYRIVPRPAEECEFRPKLQRWSGEI